MTGLGIRSRTDGTTLARFHGIAMLVAFYWGCTVICNKFSYCVYDFTKVESFAACGVLWVNVQCLACIVIICKLI